MLNLPLKQLVVETLGSAIPERAVHLSGKSQILVLPSVLSLDTSSQLCKVSHVDLFSVICFYE